MSAATAMCCPVCHADLTIEQLFAHAETREAFTRLAALLPAGGKLLAYAGLFAPAKHRMTIARQVKVIEQLLPDLERGAIERKGREWRVSHEQWHAAIDQMLAARDAGKITLPLTSHGYLYEILCSLANKAEADQERETEDERKAPRAASEPSIVQVLAAAAAPAIATAPVAPSSSPLVRRMHASRRTADASSVPPSHPSDTSTSREIP